MKRSLLIVVLGIAFLVLMTALGTLLESIIPHRPTPQTQIAQTGPYQVTLQVQPNPPSITQPATLAVQLVQPNTKQAVTNARVTLQDTMETMDMGTDQANAHYQGNGTYTAQVQFSMSGPWQIHVIIALPNSKTQSVDFTVTAQ